MPMPISTRDRRALAAGSAIVALLLAYLIFWPPSMPDAPVAVTEPVVPPPASASSAPAPTPAAPPADTSQLRLYGVLGDGAVIGLADGSQRYVPLGREILPGVKLERLEVHHAVLASPGGEIRLGFDGVARGQAAAPGQAAATPAGEAALRAETTRYRLGLAPRSQQGRVTGFTVRADADLPILARAGIRPGDVIVSVNGSTLNEEQMLELAWTIANSATTRFEVERGGRRVRLALQGG